MAKEKKTEKEETKKTKTKKEETEAKSVKKTNKHEVNVRIEGKEWQDALDEAFQKRQKTVKVDGFRQGKVPRSVFEKKFGKESSTTYNNIEKENKKMFTWYNKIKGFYKKSIFVENVEEFLLDNDYFNRANINNKDLKNSEIFAQKMKEINA